MKNLLRVSLIILGLSFPAFAGHTLPAGAYCTPCNSNGPCICDNGENTRSLSPVTKPGSQEAEKPRHAATAGAGAELLLALATILLWLRFRA